MTKPKKGDPLMSFGKEFGVLVEEVALTLRLEGTALEHPDADLHDRIDTARLRMADAADRTLAALMKAWRKSNG